MVEQTWSSLGEYTWQVPSGVESVEVDLYGAQGGKSSGGLGGHVAGTLPVTPGETLTIRVGGQGATKSGGYNGGGNGGEGHGSPDGAGGGGASDIRQGGTALADRVVVAGGGGGRTYYSRNGGDGGADTGQTGQGGPEPGTGGTQSAGGEGGIDTGGNGEDGSLGDGGDGGSNSSGYDNHGGGGGGGGYYGGGGGGSYFQDPSTGGGGSNYDDALTTVSANERGTAPGGAGEVTISYTEAPAVPDNVDLTYVADDQLDLSFDADRSAGPVEGYHVEIRRDGGAWMSASPAGVADVTDDGSATYTESYGPGSDQPYEQVVGVDSSFRFRVKAYNTDGSGDEQSSGWALNGGGSVKTSSVAPHDPQITRPDGDTIEVSWERRTDVPDYVKLQARRDTGSGWESWTGVGNFGHDTGAWGDGLDEDWVNSGAAKGERKTIRCVVGHPYHSVGTDYFQRDARYQFRLRSVRRTNDATNADLMSDWVYVEPDPWGAGSIMDDSFDSGDLSGWTAKSSDGTDGFNDPDSGLYTDDSFIQAENCGITGPDDGSHYLALQSDDRVSRTLGDLTGHSDVLVYASMATGSMDSENIGQSAHVQWSPDGGSTWTTLKSNQWEYNRQGWVQLACRVPDADLGTDCVLRLRGRAYAGDSGCFDNIVVATQRPELTTPSKPADLSVYLDGRGTVQAEWTNTMTFNAGGANQGLLYRGGEQLAKEVGGNLDEATFTGLDDGATYEVRVSAYIRRYNADGSKLFFNSGVVSDTTTTYLPSPSDLAVEDVQQDVVDLSFIDNAAEKAGYRVYASREQPPAELSAPGEDGGAFTDDPNRFDLSGDITLMATVTPDVIGPDDGSGPERTGIMGTHFNLDFAVNIRTAGGLQAYHGNRDGESPVHDATQFPWAVMEAGTTRRFVLVRSMDNTPNGEWSVYVDGEASPNNPTQADVEPGTGDEPLAVGRSYLGAVRGTIRNVAIYDRAMSESEALVNSVIGTTPPAEEARRYYYPLDSLEDRSGYGNDLSLYSAGTGGITGAGYTQVGSDLPPTGAYRLNESGTDDSLSNNSLDAGGLSELTVVHEFAVDGPSNDDNGYPRMFSMGGTESWAQAESDEIMVRLGGNADAGGSNQVILNIPLEYGTPVRWAQVYVDGGNPSVTGYLDGEVVDTDDSYGGTTRVLSPHILSNGSYTRTMNGRTGRLWVFSRALSSSEITMIHQGNGGSVDPTGLIAAYEMGEGDGDSVPDQSGNGHSLTVNGGRQVPPMYPIGFSTPPLLDGERYTFTAETYSADGQEGRD
ncbi:glycine-rich protein [Halomarina rubra]|uniref:receptor protein-tyrosine kinase n=1 Tax=Halomarina rubra TaxID=2071873 RepID=A0ABD6ARI5_9EURY|nr:glycine-rich protein [Halomarina rubra]